MPVPRDAGFTGVDWSARTTERLAGDLLGGSGVQPTGRAAQETARLAGVYGTAAVQLDRIVAKLDGAVDTGRRGERARPTGPLPEYARWLARHAADLAEYAAKLAVQGAAYDTAARAMPSVADAQKMTADREATAVAAAAGGADPAVAALQGAAADAERAEQHGHVQAAAVMVAFERASEPLRTPWEFAAPPKSTAPANRDKKEKSTRGAGSGRGGGAGVGASAAPLSAFPVGSLQRDAPTAARPVITAGGAAGQAGRGVPMMPAAMMGAGAAGAGKRTVQPTGAVPSDADDAPEAFVVHAAPAVLGDADASVGEHL